ncbi:MAG TPA: hypothetical protein VL443_15835 [Cyclobacteriaceae bacterium]|jgi:hypothetical protein|nr:hypothetical protein [Cyclobacteriaceae bacterium]
MNEIRTYNDLLKEKERLETALAIQKKLIHQDFIELKEEYRPALNLLSTVSRITNKSKTNPLVAIGINLAGEIFLKNMLLAKSNKIVQFTVPYIAKKAVNYILTKGLVNLFSKMQERSKKKTPESSIEDILVKKL